MMQTATATKPPKVYVAVKADFAADGTMFPRIITWEDGEKYEIRSEERRVGKEYPISVKLLR